MWRGKVGGHSGAPAACRRRPALHLPAPGTRPVWRGGSGSSSEPGARVCPRRGCAVCACVNVSVREGALWVRVRVRVWVRVRMRVRVRVRMWVQVRVQAPCACACACACACGCGAGGGAGAGEGGGGATDIVSRPALGGMPRSVLCTEVVHKPGVDSKKPGTCIGGMHVAGSISQPEQRERAPGWVSEAGSMHRWNARSRRRVVNRVMRARARGR